MSDPRSNTLLPTSTHDLDPQPSRMQRVQATLSKFNHYIWSVVAPEPVAEVDETLAVPHDQQSTLPISQQDVNVPSVEVSRVQQAYTWVQKQAAPYVAAVVPVVEQVKNTLAPFVEQARATIVPLAEQGFFACKERVLRVRDEVQKSLQQRREAAAVDAAEKGIPRPR